MTLTPDFHLLLLDQLPIFQQLQLEEALLRADERNWCLINTGTSPGIVMGISGQAEQLIDHALLHTHPVPVIRRFSGGGTVFVDPNTIFITWICNSTQTDTPCCPEKIHRWVERQLQPALPSLPLRLLENDYVIGPHKCGGNAQYLCKRRWLHHSSFLWDYDPFHMSYLQLPQKRPSYRGDRPHEQFLCRLKDHLHCCEDFYAPILQQLRSNYQVTEVPFDAAWPITYRPHRKATIFLGGAAP